MAVSNVYINITRIPEGDSKYENVQFKNISSSTTFNLHGGKYGVSVIGTLFGSVTIQIMGADGQTLLTAMPAFTANGYAVADLPAGLYQLTLA